MILPQKIMQMLNGIDPKKLKEGMNAISELTKSPEGQQLLSQFQNMDKAEILKKLESQKDSSPVLSELANNMQNIDQESLLSELSNQPELIQKMRDFLNTQKAGESK